jgi:hypothetical protein
MPLEFGVILSGTKTDSDLPSLVGPAMKSGVAIGDTGLHDQFQAVITPEALYAQLAA